MRPEASATRARGGSDWISHVRFFASAHPDAVVLGAVILCGVLLRLYAFDASILNHHFVRQADTAAMAQNFATEGMNILLPRIDWRGASSGIVESEFPLYPYTVAALYTVFGEHVELARALNLTFFVLTALVLFDFVRRTFDSKTALVSVLLYAFNPIAAVFDHSFQADSMIALLTISTVNFYSRWCEEGRPRDYLIAASALALAILVKPLNVYLAAPLFFFTFSRYGWGMVREWRLWLFAVLVLAPYFVWYNYAYSLWLEHGNTLFRAYTEMGYSALWSPNRQFSLVGRESFSYANVLAWRGVFLWTAVGALLPFVWGVVCAIRQKNWALIAWAAAFAVTGIVFAYQQYAHDYYQWPLALLCTVFAAHGAMQLWGTPGRGVRIASAVVLGVYLAAGLFYAWLTDVPGPYLPKFSLSWTLKAYFAAGAILLLGFAVLPRMRRQLVAVGVAVAVSFGSWTYVTLAEPYPFDTARREFASELEALTAPDDRIFIAQNMQRQGWFQHQTAEGELLGYAPVDFYLSHRNGWSIGGQYARPAFVEKLRKRGASVFAAFCCEWGSRPVAQEFPALISYLDCAQTPLVSTDRYVIYRLDEPHSRPDGSACPTG